MRVNFVLSEVATGLRRNLTMTVAMIITTAISLGLMGTGLLIAGMITEMKEIYYDKVQVSIFLADEPTGNLDPETSEGIMLLLERINRTGTTVVMATHDYHIVDSMRRRVIELNGGQITRDQSRGVYGVGR